MCMNQINNYVSQIVNQQHHPNYYYIVTSQCSDIYTSAL